MIEDGDDVRILVYGRWGLGYMSFSRQIPSLRGSHRTDVVGIVDPWTLFPFNSLEAGLDDLVFMTLTTGRKTQIVRTVH